MRSASEMFRLAARVALIHVEQNIIETARRENSRIMSTEPKPVGFRLWIDNNEQASTALATLVANSVETLRPARIEIQYDRIDSIVTFAAEQLKQHSPVLTGAFRDSWEIFVNGTMIRGSFGGAQFKRGDELLFINLQPYARKIVLGHMTLSVPHNITDIVADAVNARFGNSVKATTKFVPIEGGYVTKGTARTNTRRGRSGGAMTYPALRIVNR